jgi:phosphorylase kinase alpha/beta subunit
VGWQQQHPEQPAEDYPSHKAEAWDGFYRSSPAQCRRWQLLALKELAELQPA